MLHVVKPRAVVVPSVTKHVLAMTSLLSIYKTAIVPIAIEKRDFSSSIYIISLELTFISRTVCPNQHAESMLYFCPSDPMSSVLVAAFKCKFRPPFCFFLRLFTLLRRFTQVLVYLNFPDSLLLGFGLCLILLLSFLSFPGH